MPRMTGGEALVQQLYREGGRVVFGLPGVQLYGVMAALRDEPRVRFIQTRHEGATSYMADGYARAGGAGGFGSALVVPGPGLLNALSGLSTAYSASSPVFMISGQIPKAQIGKDIGLLHEVNDQLDCVRPVTKWQKRVPEIREVPAAVHQAVYHLRSGRPRPVEIELSPETMEDEDDVELLDPVRVERAIPPREDLDRATELLLAARRPLIYAGGGIHASDAHEALGAAADYLQAGVVTSAEGKGAVSDRNELSMGAAVWAGSPVRELLVGADVVLVVGSRLALAALKPEQQVVQIDVDPDEIGRNHRKTFPLVGDARATLEALVERLRAGAPARPSRKEELHAVREATAALDVQEPNATILRSLRAGVPEDAIFVSGMTQIGYYSRPFWPVYQARTFITSSYSGNLGYAYPVALGAKVARPEKAVVSVSGDGGFMYNAQEIATAVQHKINVVAVVFNDEAYGNVARDLDESWGGQFGAALVNPDFVKLAEAYGARGLRAKEPAEVGRLVRDAVQMDRPVLIEVKVSRMARPAFFAALRKPTKYQQR